VNDILVMMVAMHCHLTPPSAPAPLGLGADDTTLVLGVGSTPVRLNQAAAVLKTGHREGQNGPLPQRRALSRAVKAAALLK
jgi:hypothetical protein